MLMQVLQPEECRLLSIALIHGSCRPDSVKPNCIERDNFVVSVIPSGRDFPEESFHSPNNQADLEAMRPVLDLGTIFVFNI
jgi:hypothetical protein